MARRGLVGSARALAAVASLSLLGALALPAPAAAQTVTDVLEATITAGASSTATTLFGWDGGFDGDGNPISHCSHFDSPCAIDDPNNIVLAGDALGWSGHQRYLTVVQHDNAADGGTLEFWFNSEPRVGGVDLVDPLADPDYRARLTFHVGTQSFDGADSDFKSGRNNVFFISTGLTWASGDEHTVRITLRALPTVTIAADHESFTAVLDQVTFTLTRTEDLAEELEVSVALTQDKDLIGSDHLAQTVTFQAGEATATLNIPAHFFAGSTVTGETTLTATVQDVVGSPNAASTRIRVADPAVTASFEQAAYTFDEAAGDATVAVILRTATGVPVPHADIFLSINTATVDRASPDDFEDPVGSIQFIPSDFTADGADFTARKEVTLAIVDDELDEPDEALTVILEPLGSTQTVVAFSEPDGRACPLDNRCDATVTITDNDPLPMLSVADARASEERGVVMFEVTLSPASGKTVTVDFAASTESGDTATSPADFTAKSGTLTFNPGVDTVSFEIQTVNDSIFAADETFTATLSNPTNATISDATAKGTIINDDAAPIVGTPADALVSNLGRSAATVGLDEEFSQRFTTGSNEEGYTLIGVDIVSTTTTVFAIRLCETDTSGQPVSPCTNLVDPASFAEGTNSFTAPAATLLAKDTTYSVHGKNPSHNRFGTTLEDGEDAAAGWSIENAVDDYIEDSWSPQEDGHAVRIAIRGYEGYEGAATGPTLSVGDAEGNEGDGVTFTVRLSEAAAAEVTATWTASVGRSGNSDEVAELEELESTTGPVSIAIGDTAGTFKVPTAEDENDENDETFTVTLRGVSANAHLAPDPTAKGTIIDDDPTPMLSVADRSASEEHGLVVFTVTLSSSSSFSVDVDYTTSAESGDTATSPADFTAETHRLHVPPYDLSATIGITTIDDSIDEPDETFTVTLSNPSNAQLAPDPTAKGTIINDDAVLNVGDAEGNEGDEMTFTVMLSRAAAADVTATWTASIESGDTAVLEDLGSMTTGPVSIAAGDTMTTFAVPTTADTTDEDDETFTVTLSSPSNAQLAPDPTAKGTITDAGVAPIDVTLGADTLVSTANQDASTIADGGSVSEWRFVAQEFTTGMYEDGYTVTGVDIVSASSSRFTAKVCDRISISADCTVLTPPDSFAVGVMSFTVPADTVLTLSKDTTYAMVVEAAQNYLPVGRYLHGWGVTDSTSEDVESAAGWSVANGYRWSTSPSTLELFLSPTNSDQTLRMVIRGAAVAASTDATLRTLVVNDGTSDLTLTPDFVPDKYEYAASVVTTVDEVTVTAMKNDSGAMIEYLDEDDMTLADAGTGGCRPSGGGGGGRHRHQGEGDGPGHHLHPGLHGDGEPGGPDLHAGDRRHLVRGRHGGDNS